LDGSLKLRISDDNPVQTERREGFFSEMLGCRSSIANTRAYLIADRLKLADMSHADIYGACG